MSERRVILELSHSQRLESFAFSAMEDETTTLNLNVTPKLDTFQYDKSFAAIPLPKVVQQDTPSGELYDMTADFSFDSSLPASTYLVRGTVEEDAIPEFEAEMSRKRSVVGVYTDMAIEPMIVCPGSPPVGSDSTVERLLCTEKLHDQGINGKGVMVAIVDTGVNMNYLNSQGKHPTFDPVRSWAWNTAVVTPGDAPVGHGTMCAFDVCITAPKCTLLDIALLHSISAGPGGTVMQALLSDAIRAYRHLLDIMEAPTRPGESSSLVVNNSWGMFHPDWDWPVGHPSNYSDNPNHPFNRIVATLERAGADILFAAGNCGEDCPDSRCGSPPETSRAIYGANSSAAVTCVAGVDTTKARVGYSAIGPGRLEKKKPDISGYTHFSGSGVYTADGGTSAACPVVSGVVAAVRSKRPYNPGDSQTSPAAIRNLLTSTAEDLGPTGYDFQFGYGVVDACKILDKIGDKKPPVRGICRRYPWLCDSRWWRWLFGNTGLFNAPMAAPLGSEESMVSIAAGIESGISESEIELLLPEILESTGLSPEQLAYSAGYWMAKQELADSTKIGPDNPGDETG